MYEELAKRIQWAKRAITPREALFQVYGEIKMAFELGAISKDEFMRLNHEAVYKGINNPKYF
jgi:hypothetical protein